MSTKIMVPMEPLSPPEKDPVVDNISGIQTCVSYVNYLNPRRSGRTRFASYYGERELGYSSQNPKEVFEALFPNFVITRYLEKELFENEIVGNDTPMAGLAIYSIGSEVEGARDIGELVSEGVFDEVRRSEPVSDEHVYRMIERVKQYAAVNDVSDDIMAFLDPKTDQNRFDNQQVVDMLTPYLVEN